MVGPCVLVRPTCEDTKGRINRSMGVGGVGWGGAERVREGATWDLRGPGEARPWRAQKTKCGFAM